MSGGNESLKVFGARLLDSTNYRHIFFDFSITPRAQRCQDFKPWIPDSLPYPQNSKHCRQNFVCRPQNLRRRNQNFILWHENFIRRHQNLAPGIQDLSRRYPYSVHWCQNLIRWVRDFAQAFRISLAGVRISFAGVRISFPEHPRKRKDRVLASIYNGFTD